MHPVYAVHPGVLHSAKMLANLPARTGRSLQQWVALLQAADLADEAAQADWLRAHHGLGGGTIDMITSAASGRSLAWGDVDCYLAEAPGYVDALYAGKAHLRAIHDALIAAWLEIDPAIRFCPARTLVSVYHRHACARLRPATRATLELGLSLRGVPLPARLQPISGAGADDRIQARARLGAVDEIDEALRECMRMAYQQAA